MTPDEYGAMLTADGVKWTSWRVASDGAVEFLRGAKIVARVLGLVVA